MKKHLPENFSTRILFSSFTIASVYFEFTLGLYLINTLLAVFALTFILLTVLVPIFGMPPFFEPPPVRNNKTIDFVYQAIVITVLLLIGSPKYAALMMLLYATYLWMHTHGPLSRQA